VLNLSVSESEVKWWLLTFTQNCYCFYSGADISAPEISVPKAKTFWSQKFQSRWNLSKRNGVFLHNILHFHTIESFPSRLKGGQELTCRTFYAFRMKRKMCNETCLWPTFCLFHNLHFLRHQIVKWCIINSEKWPSLGHLAGFCFRVLKSAIFRNVRLKIEYECLNRSCLGYQDFAHKTV